MRKIILILIAFSVSLNLFASPAISNFSIVSSYLQNSQIKVYGGVGSYFVAAYSISRSYIGSPPVLEDVNVQVRLIAGTTNITELDNGMNYRTVSTSDFITPTGSISSYSNQKYIEGIIPDVINSSRIYLQIRYFDIANNSWTDWITSSVNFATTNVNPSPLIDVPVPDSYPLYAYWCKSGGMRFYTTYKGPEVHNTTTEVYRGVIGYIFKVQKPGTVPLYEYYHNYDTKDIVFFYSTISTHPVFGNPYSIVGYVYPSPVTKTLPVYQYADDSVYNTYETQPGIPTFDSRLDGEAFYILQSPPETTYPLPDVDTRELRLYYSSNNGDHYYTTGVRNYPGYVFEKIDGYVYTIPKPGTVPLYQYFNKSTGDHYYPTIKQNYGGYIYEGIVGYVYPTSGYANTWPIYGYFTTITGDHYYSKQNTTYGGYIAEGLKFYLLQYNH